MYKLSDYEGKSERVRIAMLIDDAEESAGVIAAQIVDGFRDTTHFCNMTRIVIEDLDEEVCARGIAVNDSIRGEIKGIYKRYLERGLKDAGFEDVREVKQNGELWFRFYNYGVFN